MDSGQRGRREINMALIVSSAPPPEEHLSAIHHAAAIFQSQTSWPMRPSSSSIHEDNNMCRCVFDTPCVCLSSIQIDDGMFFSQMVKTM